MLFRRQPRALHQTCVVITLFDKTLVLYRWRQQQHIDSPLKGEISMHEPTTEGSKMTGITGGESAVITAPSPVKKVEKTREQELVGSAPLPLTTAKAGCLYLAKGRDEE